MARSDQDPERMMTRWPFPLLLLSASSCCAFIRLLMLHSVGASTFQAVKQAHANLHISVLACACGSQSLSSLSPSTPSRRPYNASLQIVFPPGPIISVLPSCRTGGKILFETWTITHLSRPTSKRYPLGTTYLEETQGKGPLSRSPFQRSLNDGQRMKRHRRRT